MVAKGAALASLVLALEPFLAVMRITDIAPPEALEAAFKQAQEALKSPPDEDFQEWLAEIDVRDKLGRWITPNVLNELRDYHDFLGEVGKVYCHVTRDLISYPNTLAREVISISDQIHGAELDELMREKEEELAEVTDPDGQPLIPLGGGLLEGNSDYEEPDDDA